MERVILTYPENKDILTLKSEPVKDIFCEETQSLIQDLKDTLKISGGVGISAIQIGIPKQICCINYAGTELTLINPKITWKRSGTNGIKEFKEGCLSAPGRFVMVPRAQKVTCEYFDEEGNSQIISQGGWISCIIQHELDHFSGWCPVFLDEETENNVQ